LDFKLKGPHSDRLKNICLNTSLSFIPCLKILFTNYKFFPCGFPIAYFCTGKTVTIEERYELQIKKE